MEKELIQQVQMNLQIQAGLILIMIQVFTRNNKCRGKSLYTFFFSLSNIITKLQYFMLGLMVDLSSWNSVERNSMEQIKTPVFLEAVVWLQAVWELQFYSKVKEKPVISKDDFSSRADTHPI